MKYEVRGVDEARALLASESRAHRSTYEDFTSFKGEYVIDGTYTLEELEALVTLARAEAQR